MYVYEFNLCLTISFCFNLCLTIFFFFREVNFIRLLDLSSIKYESNKKIVSLSAGFLVSTLYP